MRTWVGHKDTIITSVKFTPDVPKIIYASRDKNIKIWQINGKLIQS
ncbi:MAG: hypothetical protein HRU34_10910 [Richelia sp.]|nr:hypothetical protein [Richelia sp.]